MAKNDSANYPGDQQCAFVVDDDSIPISYKQKRQPQFQLLPCSYQKETVHRKDKTKRGIVLLLLSAFLFSFMGLFLQYTGRAGIPSTELVFARAVFQGTFVVIGMLIYRVDYSSSSVAFDNNQQRGDGDGHDDDNVETKIKPDIILSDDELLDEEKKLDNEKNGHYEPPFSAHETSSLLSKNREYKNNMVVNATHEQTDGYCFTKTSSISKTISLPPTRMIQHPFGTTLSMRKVVLFRGIIGGFGFVNYYYTLSTLPLGDATMLLSMHPIMTPFLARFVLREEIRPLHLLAAIFSVVGAALISRPSFLFGNADDDNHDHKNRPQVLGYVTALLGSLCASGVIVLIRKAGRVGAHTLQLLFSWAVFGVSFSLFIGALAALSAGDQLWRLPSQKEMPSVLGVCVSGTFAHFLLNYSGKLIPATPAGLIRSSDIFWAYLLEITVLGEYPQKQTWLGALFVCSSLVIILLSSNELTSNKKIEQAVRVGNLAATK